MRSLLNRVSFCNTSPFSKAEGAVTVVSYHQGKRGDFMSVRSNKLTDPPMSPPDLELLKLRDNIRNERHWLTKSRLITLFHRREVELRPTKRNEGKWKVSDTAKCLGYSNGYISESIKITEFMEENEQAVNWSKVTRELVMALIKKKL